MLLILYECVTVLLLVLATISGVVALDSLNKDQLDYKLSRVVKRGTPFYKNKNLKKLIVYLVLSFSTASALLEAFLRIIWHLDVGWESSSNNWGFWWLTSHSLDAIVYTGVHVLLYMNSRKPNRKAGI